MISVPEEELHELMREADRLRSRVAELLEREDIRQRIADIDADPSIGGTEKDLNEYLRSRGVRIDELED